MFVAPNVCPVYIRKFGRRISFVEALKISVIDVYRIRNCEDYFLRIRTSLNTRNMVDWDAYVWQCTGNVFRVLTSSIFPAMTGVTHEVRRNGRTEEKLDSIDADWKKSGEQTVQRFSPPAAADRAYRVIT